MINTMGIELPFAPESVVVAVVSDDTPAGSDEGAATMSSLIVIRFMSDAVAGSTLSSVSTSSRVARFMTKIVFVYFSSTLISSGVRRPDERKTTCGAAYSAMFAMTCSSVVSGRWVGFRFS